jgi:hypothetical protein
MPASRDVQHKAKIVVDGVELTVTQTRDSVSVSRVVGRDRKNKIDITSAKNFALDAPAAITFVDKLKRVAALSTAPCTCDYRLGFSDHAEHCKSIYVARSDDGACFDDD